ncbi:MAG: YgeY family selenium metabolism-linked hydrolase [Endomicrobia bacterium]|nr:YgeY family selenium metabolism-linked hydrolase [Endomicrobiia bacterium]MCX7716677.1 YgeY family selenium metabolism-linked hydrolase [Endomicrobiia bacterium]
MKINLPQINSVVNSYKKDIINFAKDVIRIPSLSCKEGKLVARIAQEMKKVGFDKVKVDLMGNVIGQIGNGKTKIMVDAHIDTVDVGDISQWETNPFTPVIRNGKIYGRGATDQKLAIVAMVYAGKLIKQLNLTGDYTLWFVGSCQEEDCDGLPLLHIIQKEKLKPDYVVITEPTNLNIYRGHRGRIELKIVVKGKSCHASAPERGDNAVYKISYIIQEITKLNTRLKHDKFLGKGSVAVTSIECKTPSLNAIPDEATIYLDRRLTFGETKDTVIKELKSLPSIKKFKPVIKILQYSAVSWKGLKLQQEKYFPTWVIPENHKLVRAAYKSASLVLGKKPKIGKWTFSTNGVATAGKLGIPTVGFGPGNEIYAHTTNEQMPVEHLLKSTMFYGILPVILTDSST